MAEFAQNYKRLPVFLKWIELLVAIVTIAILQDSGEYPGSTVYRTTTVYTAIGSYLIILPVLLVGYNTGLEVQKLLVIIWVSIASILWITAGALIFDQYHVLPKIAQPAALLCSGLLALLNGCLFIADAIATYREE